MLPIRIWIFLILLAVLGTTIISECTDSHAEQDSSLASDLKEFESTRDALAEVLSTAKRNLAIYSSDKDSLAHKLEQLDKIVQHYLINHTKEVAAITLGVSGHPALGDNRYAQNAKDVGGVVSVAAAIYAMVYPEQIEEVYQYLLKAGKRGKRMEQQIDDLDSRIDKAANTINEYEQELALVNENIHKTRQKIF